MRNHIQLYDVDPQCLICGLLSCSPRYVQASEPHSWPTPTVEIGSALADKVGY